MKAITYTQYGSPDVLQFIEVEKPAPKDNEVLVKVHAAATNPYDWHMLRGEPFFARFVMGFPKPKNRILGADFAGTVEAVGSSVTQFKPGDAVFGEVGAGAFAELVCVAQDQVALKPANSSFEEAAAVPMVGYTAIQGLRDYGHLQAGQKVLINGASGGIGTFAVQYARSVGAEVTGVCSTRNVELVRSIGADHVVDYTQEDFSKTGQRYDLIFDTVSNRSAADYRRALTPQWALCGCRVYHRVANGDPGGAAGIMDVENREHKNRQHGVGEIQPGRFERDQRAFWKRAKSSR